MIAALFFTVKKDRIENLAAKFKKIGKYFGRTGIGRTDVGTQRLRKGIFSDVYLCAMVACYVYACWFVLFLVFSIFVPKVEEFVQHS